MSREQLLQRITVDPQVCFGKAVIRDTRIAVAVILENLAEAVPEAEILAAYPALCADDLRAALAYAAETARERVIPAGITTATKP